MIRSTLISILFLAPVSGCGGNAVPKEAAVLQHDKIPVEVSYPITSDEDDGGLNPMRRLVDVRLNMKVSPEILWEIALAVKAKEKRQYERTVMFYYLPVEFPELTRQPWASSHFDPTLDVKILGLSKQEEEAMRTLPLNHKGKRIGAWLQDNQYKTLDLIYDVDGAVKISEIWSPTARMDSDMIELPSVVGRRFKKTQGSDIYDVDQNATLRISNSDGKVFSAARPFK